MLTRFYLFGFLAFCYTAVQAYTIFDSIDSHDNCHAPARRRSVLNPHHRSQYRTEYQSPNELQAVQKPEARFKPFQWLMSIIHIRGITMDRKKETVERPSPFYSNQEFYRSRDLQKPVQPKRHSKMLIILKHKPETRVQPNNFYM